MKIRLESGGEITVRKPEDLKITLCYKDFKRVYVLHKSLESGLAIIKKFESRDDAETCKAMIEGALNSGEKVYKVFQNRKQ